LLFEAIRQKSPATLARQDLEQIALTGFARHGFDARKRLLKVWEWDPKKGKGYDGLHHDEAARSRIPKLSDAELARFLLDCVYVNDLQVSAWSTDQAERLTAAQRLRINVEAIRKESAPEAKTKKGNILKAPAVSKLAVRAARRRGRKGLVAAVSDLSAVCSPAPQRAFHLTCQAIIASATNSGSTIGTRGEGGNAVGFKGTTPYVGN